MKHPYEAFGIIVAGICLVFVMAIPIGDFVMQEFVQRGSGGSGGDTVEKYIPSVPRTALDTVLDNYYKNNMDMQLDCKKTSADLQEFYDCVNG